MTPNKQTEPLMPTAAEAIHFAIAQVGQIGDLDILYDRSAYDRGFQAACKTVIKYLEAYERELKEHENQRTSQPAAVVGYSREQAQRLYDIAWNTGLDKGNYQFATAINSLTAPGRLPTVEECIKWMHDRFYSGKPLAKTDIMTYCQTPIK